MKYVMTCGAAIVLVLSGCGEPPHRYRMKENVELRALAEEDCGWCKSANVTRYGGVVVPVKLGPVIARAGDIVYLERSGTDPISITVVYAPFAQNRIREATTDNLGKLSVFVVGKDAALTSRISTPYSKGSQWNGLTKENVDQVITLITDGPYTEDSD